MSEAPDVYDKAAWLAMAEEVERLRVALAKIEVRVNAKGTHAGDYDAIREAIKEARSPNTTKVSFNDINVAKECK